MYINGEHPSSLMQASSQSSLTRPKHSPLKGTPSDLKVKSNYRSFVKGDDAQQFDFVREKLSTLNWILADKVVEEAYTAKSQDYGRLVQLCTAFGIAYDKAFGKRDTGIKPLSFPDPLLRMVRKGLLSTQATSKKPLGESCVQDGTNLAIAHPVPPAGKQVSCPTNSMVEITHPTPCGIERGSGVGWSQAGQAGASSPDQSPTQMVENISENQKTSLETQLDGGLPIVEGEPDPIHEG